MSTSTEALYSRMLDCSLDDDAEGHMEDCYRYHCRECGDVAVSIKFIEHEDGCSRKGKADG